jgi:hypothetical protein
MDWAGSMHWRVEKFIKISKNKKKEKYPRVERNAIL